LANERKPRNKSQGLIYLTYLVLSPSCANLHIGRRCWYWYINRCDAAHEKVPNRWNGAISMMVQRICQGIKQNKNYSKIP